MFQHPTLLFSIYTFFNIRVTTSRIDFSKCVTKVFVQFVRPPYTFLRVEFFKRVLW